MASDLAASSLSVGIFYRDLLSPGGMPRETALLAKGLCTFVDRVVHYCYVSEPSRKGNTWIEGVPVRAFYVPKWRRDKDPFRPAKGIGEIIRRNEDEISVLVLVGSFVPENIPIARAARKSGLPYVVSVGNTFNPTIFSGAKGLKKRLYESAFERKMINGAVAIRLYSEAQIPHLMSHGYADNGRFFIAKEGIDWDLMEREGGMPDPSSSELPPNPPSFGFLGRLSVHNKGLDILLEAWSLYKQFGGQGTLRIAGPVSRRDSLRLARLRRSLDLPAAKFLPPIHGAAKYAFLKSLSYLIHPSRHEGIPRVVREALAVGCPVVVTENTNLHDVVETHHAGAVVRTDPRDLARTLSALEQSQRDWTALRNGARSAARALSWKNVGHDLSRALVERLTK